MSHIDRVTGERVPSRKAREPSKKIDGRVYILHMREPIGSEKHSIQHYIGWTPRTVAERHADHKAGRGARLTQVANEKGIDYWPVCDWPGSKDHENNIKASGSAKPLCPECTPSPRVPRIIQAAIKREARSARYYAAKEKAQAKMREIMKTPATPGEKLAIGREAANKFVSAMLAKGMPVHQIEAAAENLSAGQRGGDQAKGWNLQIESDLQMAREVEKRDEIARAKEEEMSPVDDYRQGLTALVEHDARTYEPPSWLPTEKELARTPAYSQREAG